MITVCLMMACLFALSLILGASHTHSFTWSKGSESVATEVAITTDGEKNIDASIAASAVDQLVNFAIDKDDMRSLFILATGDLTIETNHATVPLNTIALKANEPVVYRTKSGTDGTVQPGHANPFAAADVTQLFVTNPNAAVVALTIRALYDATP